jgi:adenylate cyclase
MIEPDTDGRFGLEKLVLFAADLAGYTRTVATRDAIAVAQLLDRYYVEVARIVERHGGRTVKFMGDGCFAVFPEERCLDAVDAAHALLALDLGEPGLRMGVAIHLAQVASGELGPPGARRFDVVGAGVNHLFRMGRGAGMRISEPVYRRLPNERRGRWRKDEPPASYELR